MPLLAPRREPSGGFALRRRQVGSGAVQEEEEEEEGEGGGGRHCPALGSPPRRGGWEGAGRGQAWGRRWGPAGRGALPVPSPPLPPPAGGSTPAPGSAAPPAPVAAAAGPMVAARRRRWGVPALLLAYVGYVGLGAGVLQALERPAEVQAAQRLLQQHWELLANHTCLRGPGLQRLIEVSPGVCRPLRRRGGAKHPPGWELPGQGLPSSRGLGGGAGNSSKLAFCLPVISFFRDFFLNRPKALVPPLSMRTHRPTPKKLPTAWKKFSAPRAAPPEQERAAPPRCGPAGLPSAHPRALRAVLAFCCRRVAPALLVLPRVGALGRVWKRRVLPGGRERRGFPLRGKLPGLS